MDLVFLFWAISTGIICGAGLAQIACVLCFVLTIVLVVFDRIPVGRSPKVLMVSGSSHDVEARVVDTLEKYCRFYSVKSRAFASSRIDMVVELRTNKESELIREIAGLENVTSSTLLAHDGEITY